MIQSRSRTLLDERLKHWLTIESGRQGDAEKPKGGGGGVEGEEAVFGDGVLLFHAFSPGDPGDGDV